jgi:hypothetical protein
MRVNTCLSKLAIPTNASPNLTPFPGRLQAKCATDLFNVAEGESVAHEASDQTE